MVGIRGLQKEALKSCTFRGHSMGKWLYGRAIGWGVRAWCKCKKCDAYVEVNTRPEPNEIDIGGTAVALSCPYHHEPDREWWDALKRDIGWGGSLRR